MLHLWMIALMGVVVMHDAMPRFAGASVLAPGWAGVLTLVPMGAIALMQHLILSAAKRELDLTGRATSVRIAERTLTASRALALIAHVGSTLVVGWLDAIRSVIGDVIVVDEVVCVLPALGVAALGWWSFYPIEQRLRDAQLIRTLDSGEPLYPSPTRGQWVLSNIRHQLLLTLTPMLLIATWSEAAQLIVPKLAGSAAGDWLARHGLDLSSEQTLAWTITAINMVGALTVLSLTPTIMRGVWDTVRLGDGPVRDRLLSMCRERGVTIRELLVWRTHGTMINGAVMGFWGPLRYILLTDALLDRLPGEQLEAVMAHELAHAKHRHIPFLAASLLASVGLTTGAGVLLLLGAASLVGLGLPELVLVLLDAGVQLLGLFVGLIVFGFVSRRFEWQADAFAARHLSRQQEAGPSVVTPEGAQAMAGALGAVARLNHIPRGQWTWRHGSIAQRQARLLLLVGTPTAGMPIDRAVRWIKLASLAGVGVVIALAVLDARHASMALGVREVRNEAGSTSDKERTP